MAKCLVCEPAFCEPNFLYVVSDLETGASKIGISRHVTRRYAQYRKKLGSAVVLVRQWAAGCQYVAASKEARCHRLMEAGYLRLNGDWFLAEAAASCDVVERVLSRQVRR